MFKNYFKKYFLKNGNMIYIFYIFFLKKHLIKKRKLFLKIKLKTLFNTIFYMKIIKIIKFHSLIIHFYFFPLVILIDQNVHN